MWPKIYNICENLQVCDFLTRRCAQKSCDAQQTPREQKSRNMRKERTRIGNNLRKPEREREKHEKGTVERVSIVTTVLVVCSVEEKVYADSSAEAREKPKKEGRKEERMRTKETRKEIRVNRKEEKREKKRGDHRAWAVRAK